MKIKNERLTVKLDVELTAAEITRFFCTNYFRAPAQDIANVALRLNKTEVLNIVKDVMINNIFSGYNYEHKSVDNETFDKVLPLIKRKFDGIS